MPEFTYEALDKAGSTTTGNIVARDSAEAAVKVRAMGVYPTRIGTGKTGIPGAAVVAARSTGPETKNGHTAKNGAAVKNGSAAKSMVAGVRSASQKKVTRIQILLFTREMADLLDAGLPMDRGFSVLVDQTDSEAMREMLTAMQGEIRAGQPLSEALSKFPREFPRLYANMVRAGEVSGQLPGVMLRLAEFMEREQVRRSQIVAALTYPAVLITVSVLAITFLLTFVIPSLAHIFKGMGAALPLPTVMLIAVSSAVGHWWWAILLGLAVAAFGFRAWVGTSAGRYRFDSFRLQIPIIGLLTQKIVAARLVRTLGTLLGGGVPILEALDITAEAVGNVVTTDAIVSARGGVRQGETLHEAMNRVGEFLPVVTHMTAVGEETGRLSPMLLRTADMLDFEVENTMRRLTSLVEPLVVLLMGGFIAFVVLSILLPIFQVNSLAK